MCKVLKVRKRIKRLRINVLKWEIFGLIFHGKFSKKYFLILFDAYQAYYIFALASRNEQLLSHFRLLHSEVKFQS